MRSHAAIKKLAEKHGGIFVIGDSDTETFEFPSRAQRDAYIAEVNPTNRTVVPLNGGLQALTAVPQAFVALRKSLRL
jgi:hypothetical protein